MKQFAVLLVALMALCAPAHAQFSPGGGVGNTGNFIDPTFAFSAAGVATSTTGTISSGTNSLSVASATGWAVGMGIAVHNAGSGGTTELIGCVGSIAGTTFTIVTCGTNTALNASATATTQAVNHDDTAALNSAIALAKTSKRPIILPAGTYNVTSALTFVSSPISIYGVGEPNTIIQNRGTTNDIFTVTYEVAGGAVFQDFSINQAAGITPTAGFGFNIFAPDVSSYVTNLNMTRISMNQLWGGITTGAGVYINNFSNLSMYQMVGFGVVYNTPSPAGDNNFTNMMLSGNATTGFMIITADTTAITNLKLNGATLLFAAATANTEIIRVRITNPSIEGTGAGGTPACGIDFGAHGGTQIQVVGGGVGIMTATICNANNLVGSQFVGVNLYLSNSGPVGVLTTTSATTVGGLPTCSTQTQSARGFVTDQNTAVSYRGAVTGSGSTKQAVVCDGTNWLQD